MISKSLLRFSAFLLIISFLLVFAGSGTVSALDTPQRGPVPGKFIVKFKPGVRIDEARMALSTDQKLARYSALRVSPHRIEAEIWDQYYQFHDLSAQLSIAEVSDLLGNDQIESIELDYYIEFFGFPSDGLFSQQWYLVNTGQSYLGIERVEGIENDFQLLKSGITGRDIKLTPYYLSPPAETTDVVVAIVDSGTDLLHPELEGRLWVNPDEIPGNGIDDDHNGFIDDTLGYDVSGDLLTLFDPVGDNDPIDSHGHGTHIAGIIAANSDGSGIVGVAPTAKIMSVKIRPNATVAVGAAGIVYAVNAGAQVINISWGTPFESGILKEAINFARHNGVFVAIAPGNTGDNERFYPAAYDSAFVVAAGNSDGYQTEWSTYGSHIDIVAPGLDILSLRADGTDMYAEAYEPEVRKVGDLYYLADGTSMAAPMVAGAAAFMWSIRPDMTLEVLEEILLYGARDLIDPWNVGDSLEGPDTISGFGYMDITASMQLLQQGGIHFVSPIRRNRYTGDIPVMIAPIAGYTGGWSLHYTVGIDSENWTFLATADEIPTDSLAILFSDPEVEGYIRFRLTDKYGNKLFVNCIHVRGRKLQITSPADGEELQYNVAILGDAYGPDFDSMVVTYAKGDLSPYYLTSSTGEFFDSLLYDWPVSGIDTGSFRIYLHGYYGNDLLVDSVGISVSSAFAEGWPRDLGGLGALSPVCGDLDLDGQKELILGTSRGLFVLGPQGETKPGFPVLRAKNMRCLPVLYDLDGDGNLEIIATNEDGIHAFHHDGTSVEGWPVLCYTGRIPFGYGFSNPTITHLGAGEDSVVVIINRIGQILAYEFNGDPYFFSLGGLFASLDPRIADFYSYGGFTSPFVSAVDLDGDHLQEVVVGYSSPYPYSGLAVFDGRTGQPAFDNLSPITQVVADVHGTALADLDGDLLPEVIISGRDSTGAIFIWAKDEGQYDMPGWPVELPAVYNWIASYPIIADLDLDNDPEILCTFFEYDVAALYIFNSDGTAYVQRDGRPVGEAFSQSVTFSTPIVANLTGDEYPEIVFRAGHILPGTGPEMIYILDHMAEEIEGWPVTTPARPGQVLSSRFSPLIDDLDGDGLVELIIVSDGQSLLVWDFDAPYEDGANRAKFLVDNINSGYLKLPGTPTDVDDDPNVLPSRFMLSQNYPNPFNPTTVIEFKLPKRSDIRLDVYNILGRKVRTLIDNNMLAGSHKVVFDGTGLATGMYLYRISNGESTISRKMILIK